MHVHTLHHLATSVLLSSTFAVARPQSALGFEELTRPDHLVAIHTREPDALTVARLAGVDVQAVRRWPVRDWWLVTPPPDRELDAWMDEALRHTEFDTVSPVFRGLDGGPIFPTRDLLVAFDAPEAESANEAVLHALGTVRDTQLAGLDRTWRIESAERDGRRVLERAHELRRLPGVTCAEPDMVFTGVGAHLPNDPGFPNCWGLHHTGQNGAPPDNDMDAPEAWDRTIGVDSVIVVVLDTGVQQDHPDLHQIPGIDFTTDAGNGGPVNGFDNHGTPVAGCISARIDNGIGTVGVAPGCVSASARTFIALAANGTWTTQTTWTLNSLSWAQTIGARVTNNSNGYGFTSTLIGQKYQQTWNAGLTHFASAGNNSSSTITYPASIPIVNAVVAINRYGNLTSFSNFGVGIDFAAPGVDIWSTDRTGAAGYVGGNYGWMWGTSFASPYAAGVAALIASTWPSASAAQIEQVMRNSCVDRGAPGYDTTFGYGFVNAHAALMSACGAPVNTCVTTPNSAGSGATLSSSGSTSLFTDDLVLIATGCPPNVAGLFFFGDLQVQAPFGNGIRCVGGAVTRLPVRSANSSGVLADALDLGAMAASLGITAGATRYFQAWFRDPAAGGAAFDLSDALEVRFCH